MYRWWRLTVYFLVMLLALGGAAHALTIPQTMNFTGFLTDDGNEPLNEDAEIAFTFYDGCPSQTAELSTAVRCRFDFYNALNILV